MTTKKIRLDNMLVLRGLVPTVEKARALILARAVRVNDATRTKRIFLSETTRRSISKVKIIPTSAVAV